MSYYGYTSTTSSTTDYGNYLKPVTIASTPITPDARYKEIISNFKNCLKRYHDITEFPLLGSLVLMDQQLKVGDLVVASDSQSNEKINGSMTCSLTEPIILTHAFQAKGYIPIAGSTFKIIKRKKKTQQDFAQMTTAMWVNHASGAYYDDSAQQGFEDIVVLDKQTFDDNGMATVQLAECDSGYSYHVVVNSQASSESNLKILDDAYTELIVKCSNMLEKVWVTRQRAAWLEFVKRDDGVDFIQAFEAFFSGIRNKIVELYETAKNIVEWITSKNLSALREYIGEKGVEEMKRLYDDGKKEIADTLVILSDEMLLFICAYALYSYFCLLTPQQIADFAGEAAGELVLMLLLYIVLPGSVARLALDGLDSAAGIIPA